MEELQNTEDNLRGCQLVITRAIITVNDVFKSQHTTTVEDKGNNEVDHLAIDSFSPPISFLCITC